MKGWETFQNRFLRRLEGREPLAALFDYLPEAYFFAKDEQGRFVMANQPLLVILGVDHPSKLIGRTDYDFFDQAMADRYREEDRRVMASGKPVRHQVWVVPNAAGQLQWYVSSKIPLMGRGGKAIGIAGIMRDYVKAGAMVEPYQQMADVLRHITDHHGASLKVEKLADMAHLSLSQFERRFKKLFGITAQQYIMQVRINAAKRMLTETSDSVARIAHHCGFYDHSYFTKQFRRHTGVSPLAYRKSQITQQ